MSFFDLLYDIDWYCDSCDAHLNRQDGFSTVTGTWVCSRCGNSNNVTSENILSSDELENIYQVECPKCSGHMARVGYSFNKWECEDCGCIAQEDDFGNLCYQADDEF